MPLQDVRRQRSIHLHAIGISLEIPVRLLLCEREPARGDIDAGSVVGIVGEDRYNEVR